MVRIRQKRPDPFVVSTPGTLRLFPCQSYAPPAETWVLVLERGVLTQARWSGGQCFSRQGQPLHPAYWTPEVLDTRSGRDTFRVQP
ncbi:hypothetical protein ACINK0_15185 [Deinococcus sp. VB343]|uniref:Uncharacterized protein n=1 Tax=Deinococcus sp. VB142 TaxID=3112952 RepID=A0AAU6Q854_9DEIO